MGNKKRSLWEELGWEGAWSTTALILLALFQYVPFLSSFGTLKAIVGVNGLICGGVLAGLYFMEIGEGRSWVGGILPLAFAGWGLSFVI